jgi:hypothetical protein
MSQRYFLNSLMKITTPGQKYSELFPHLHDSGNDQAMASQSKSSKSQSQSETKLLTSAPGDRLI